MSANSNLLPPQCTESISTAYTAPVLIKDGVLSRLYRVSRAGKYFVVKTAKDGSGMQWDLLRREYELSIALSHPHIVTVFTFEEETSVGPGIVMEYIDGCTLAEFLLQQPSCRLRQRIMEQLLDAVAYFHRKGIVHNDLKPDNILINRVDHTLKIIDFGLSDNDANYLYRNLGCTPQYASPELRNHQPADCRSDIYSLGLIMRDVLGPRYAPVFSKALALDPSCRYANADEFTKAFLRMKSLPRRSLSALLISVILVLVAVMIAGSADNSGELRRLHIQNDSLRVELESLRGRYDQVTGTLSEISARTQRRKSFADSVYNDIESKMADIYSKLDDKLIPSYVEKVASSLSRKNIKDAYEAMLYLNGKTPKDDKKEEVKVEKKTPVKEVIEEPLNEEFKWW